MRGKTLIIVAISIYSVIITSCNKDKNLSKSNNNKTEVMKEDRASLRLRALDSVLKVMKKESPYPDDMEVLSMKEVDSITNSEIAERSLRLSKGAIKGTGYYVDPRITPELKKRALDKSIMGYVLHYKMRYRINDINVVVNDFAVVMQAEDNSIISSNDYLIDHNMLVHTLMMRLERHLLNETNKELIN